MAACKVLALVVLVRVQIPQLRQCPHSSRWQSVALVMRGSLVRFRVGAPVDRTDRRGAASVVRRTAVPARGCPRSSRHVVIRWPAGQGVAPAFLIFGWDVRCKSWGDRCPGLPHADMAQLAERYLAEVEVAGPNPAVRSKPRWRNTADAPGSGPGARKGREGSNPSWGTMAGWHESG